MSAMTVQVRKRERLGKNESRRIRAQGDVPAVVYGGGKEPVAITVDRKAIQTHFRTGAHSNTVFLLRLEGTDQQRHVMIREFARDPVHRSVLHIDFVRVEMDHKVRIEVPLHLTNTEACQGLKMGGLIDFASRSIHVECLPADIPRFLEVDVTALELGHSIRVKDLVVDRAKLRLLDDAERVMVSVVAPAKEEVPEAAAAVEGAAPVAAEPEVIKKGKKEEAEA